jgi:hypothetical protein
MKNMPSDETRKEIFKFFMRTSAPRLVLKEQQEKEEDQRKKAEKASLKWDHNDY